MANGKSDEFELDDGFIEEASGDFEGEDVSKANTAKVSLTKRRVIDELLEERRLQKALRDYDFDLEEDS